MRMTQVNRIYVMHALEGLRKLPEESVDMVITSPPYWGLRDYGRSAVQVWDGGSSCEHRWVKPAAAQESRLCPHCKAWKGQLGMEPDFRLYLKHLLAIFDEVKRALKKTGTCWVVLADSYAGSWGARSHDLEGPARRANYNTRSPTSYKPDVPEKSLCLIPFRFAVEMLERGWILRNTLIWHKPNSMPSSIKDRFTVDFENLFFFTKSQRYWFSTQYETDQGRPSGNLERFIAADGRRSRLNTHLGSSIPWVPAARGRQKRAVWTIPTKPLGKEHYAVFPEELVEIPVRAGCPKGGVVLDPFMGSGTTAVAARRLGRKFLGFEVNPEYVKLARKRLRQMDTTPLAQAA